MSSARRTAASGSIACSWNGPVSLGSIVIVQKSGDAGSKMSARSRSSADLIAASATITDSSFLATSDCASTMSIGAIVPICTRFSLSASSRLARSSDCRCALRLLIENDRSQ